MKQQTNQKENLGMKSDIKYFMTVLAIIFTVFAMYMLSAKTWELQEQVTALEKQNTELYDFLVAESLSGDSNRFTKLKEHLIKKYQPHD